MRFDNMSHSPNVTIDMEDVESVLTLRFPNGSTETMKYLPEQGILDFCGVTFELNPDSMKWCEPTKEEWTEEKGKYLFSLITPNCLVEILSKGSVKTVRARVSYANEYYWYARGVDCGSGFYINPKNIVSVPAHCGMSLVGDSKARGITKLMFRE